MLEPLDKGDTRDRRRRRRVDGKMCYRCEEEGEGKEGGKDLEMVL